MNVQDFWYATDIELHAYEKAYFNRINQKAWLEGFYNYQAQASVLSGIFAKKKSDIQEYPKQPIRFINDKKETSKTELQKDQEFRDILMQCY